jgi:carboxyl-terminal processing protease
MRKIFYYTLIVAVGLLSACAKDKKVIIVKPGDTTVLTEAQVNLIKDSVYLYTKETYLWYDAIPDYNTFKPRLFTGKDVITALSNEVNNLSQYKINPDTHQPYEYSADDPGTAKYSFIDDGSVNDELNGTNGDFGFSVFYPAANDLRIKYVYEGSPAGKAGLKRGYQITKVNGRTALDPNVSANLQFVINAIFYSDGNPLTMTVKAPDGTTSDVTLATASYTINPVLAYKVFDMGEGKKVGYVVFNIFTAASNAQPQLQKAFTAFATAGINDLVVDLRYNGGGRIETAELLDNLIVPPAKSGTPMFTYYYNDKMQAGNTPLLNAVYDIPTGYFSPTNTLNKRTFNKSGSLNLSRVFFIVTGSTASASELTINNLIPEMKVNLIGSTSYGKPVGFFALDINKFQLYVPQFETQNSAGSAAYYEGMTPGSAKFPGVEDDGDDVRKDFGDSTEVLLAHALDYVKNGTFAVSKPRVQSVQTVNTLSTTQIKSITQKISLHERKFIGMVSDKSPRHK